MRWSAISISHHNHMTAVNHAVTAVNHHMTAVNHTMTAVNHHMTAVNHPMTAVNHHATAVNRHMTAVNHPVTAVNHPMTAVNHPRHCCVCICQDGGLQCPTCKSIYGVKRGDCPDGTMSYRSISNQLPGYEGYGAIEIVYHISSGYRVIHRCFTPFS